MGASITKLMDDMAQANQRIAESSAGDYLKAFRQFSARAHADGALSRKHKELIALSIGLSKRCERCIAYHAKGALAQGATTDELLEAAFVTVIMDGGPALAHIGLIYESIEAFGGAENA